MPPTRSSTDLHWSRLINGKWQAPQSETSPNRSYVLALLDDNTAIATYVVAEEVFYRVLTPEANAWSVETLLNAGRTWALLSSSDESVAILKNAGNLLSRTYSRTDGWSATTPIASNTHDNYVSYRPVLDSEDFVFTWWNSDTDKLWFSRSKKGLWTSAPYADGRYATSLCINNDDDRIGLVQRGGAFYAVHWDGKDFIESDSLGNGDADFVSCTIDRWGNGHAFWWAGNVVWSRFVQGEGWTQAQSVSSAGVQAVASPTGELTALYNKSSVVYMNQFR